MTSNLQLNISNSIVKQLSEIMFPNFHKDVPKVEDKIKLSLVKHLNKSTRRSMRKDTTQLIKVI